ncbi:copper chaperone CopZ [Texcoconibacillus texcoconensis]|uniref:Copper chaperone n=1 Tax=Texcoconibacillus texcoconensis TaxID=1095777 RepID=A0A840QSW0_9BACI|nr:copper chaperone CopZ [Texcoconibacillus texcoconensis]MBB5174440.1 copper chaperone [Texcoconibacillus texcoconensis]
MTTKMIQVEGMTCNHCKSSVEGALNNLAGVSKAEVSLEDKNVTVEYDESQVQEQQLKDEIEEQGFDVVS